MYQLYRELMANYNNCMLTTAIYFSRIPTMTMEAIIKIKHDMCMDSKIKDLEIKDSCIYELVCDNGRVT